MSKTVTEKSTCPKCEAEIRPESAFCYNCGGRVTTDETAEPVAEGQKIEERETQPAPGMRSARDIRRRERVFDRGPRKVKWEPQAEKLDIQLIITTVVILAFSAIVIVLALYLR